MGILDKIRNHGTRPDGGQWDSANPTPDELAAAKAAANERFAASEEARRQFVQSAARAGEAIVRNTDVRNSGEVPVITPGMTPPSEKE